MYHRGYLSPMLSSSLSPMPMRFIALSRSPVCPRKPAPSVLHPRHDYPFHQVFLAEDVDDDAGDDGQDGRDHGQVPDGAV